MKKTGEIIGLPIVSLVDGGEIGTVKSLVLNGAEGSIAAIVVDDGKCYKGAKLVSFSDILGIGESALTIEQKSIIKPFTQTPELEKLLEANINIINTKVLTKKGQIKGTIIEVYFDADSGKILECHAKSDNGGDFTIPANRVYTYGSGITVIVSENESLDKPVVAKPAQPETAPVESPVTTQPAAAAQPVMETPPSEQPITQEGEDNSTEANNAMQKFEERQKKFLIGKKATRRIVTDSGVEIIDQGAEVTEEVLQKAKLAGKFVELSMSLQ